MEDVSTTVSTLMVLMSVSVEVATGLVVDTLALVCLLSLLVAVCLLNIEYHLQISMSVQRVLTTVIKSVLTLLAPSPVPATVTLYSQLMDYHVQQRLAAEVH